MKGKEVGCINYDWLIGLSAPIAEHHRVLRGILVICPSHFGTTREVDKNSGQVILAECRTCGAMVSGEPFSGYGPESRR